MALDDKVKAGFDVAAESAKQLIALGTATIGGAIALFDNSALPGINLPDGTTLFGFGIALLGLSVVFGLLTLGSIVGQLSERTETPSVYATGVIAAYSLQMLAYGLGVLLLVCFAVF